MLLKKTTNGDIETVRKPRKNRPHRDVGGPNKSISFKDSNIYVESCDGKKSTVKTKTIEWWQQQKMKEKTGEIGT